MPTLLYTYHVYIISNKNRTTFYIGVTNGIRRRILEHKAEYGSAFTSKYNLTDLLYCEEFNEIKVAIAREKQLKSWHRDWKINLIKNVNSNLEEISSDWYTEEQIKDF